MSRERTIRLAAVAVLALCVGACGDDTTSPADGTTVADYVASASVEDTQGVLHEGDVPRPTSRGPALTVNGHLTIVNGGTATLNIASATAFKTVYVAASAPINPLFLAVSGSYEIALPEAVNSADLIISFPQALPSEDFDLYFSAADTTGRIGTMQERSFHALEVGSGDVQVTLNWDADADVDLHVVDPAGYEVYWAVRQSPSGGQLDLDSNAGCAIDGVRNENITWPVGTAPQGLYTVRVDYWSSCDVTSTHYTVLIRNGTEVEIYNGTFTGAGDRGGAGSGVLIDTFTRTTGPPAAPVANLARPAIPSGPTSK